MDDFKTEENTAKNSSSEKAISFFAIRLTICLIFFVFGAFLKFQDPCKFDKLKFWYQENVCAEKYSTEEIKDYTINLAIKTKNFITSVINKN